MVLFQLLVCISLIWISISALRLLAPFPWIPQKTKLPPGPKGLPLVGSLFKLGNKPNESLTELAKTHGPLMTLQLGLITTVVISSATMAKEVLIKNDKIFAGRIVFDIARALDHDKSSMAWLDAGPHWRKLRKICNTHIFTSQRLEALEGCRHEKVKEMVEHIRESCGSGVPVDIGMCAFVTTLNLLSNTFFSVDLVDPKSSLGQEFKDLVQMMMGELAKPNVVDYFPMLRTIDPQGLRRKTTVCFRRVFAVFDEMIDRRLHSRESNCAPKNDFLEVLLDRVQEMELSCQHIKHLLLDLLTAGSETSSITVEWAMAELLCNPNAMNKAQSELAEKLKKEERQVQESDIHGLPYLQTVVKETMRLHPPAPLLIPHKAETSVEIGGFTIPKHAQVLVNAWAIGRDPQSWENPTLFWPDRFFGSDIDYRGRDLEFIPFGAGRRICPGLPLAHRMVHLMLASLLHAFNWKVPEEHLDMNYKLGMTMQKAVPLCVIPFPRVV